MRARVLAETPLERVFKTSQLEAFYIKLTVIHLCFQFSFFFLSHIVLLQMVSC